MLLQDGDTTWAAYFTAASDGQPADLHVLRWRGGQVSRGVAVSGLAPVVAERPGNTDFPWLTLQDGRPLVAYADGRTVRLAAGANPERF
jgi:hypothetical protein